ncbi:hypothetical protein GCM10022270_27420 [Terriglobus aquaticus]
MQLANASPAQQRAEEHVETGSQKGLQGNGGSAVVRKPQDLVETSFHEYPPEARQMVTRFLPLLRTLPLPLLPLLLREIAAYDYRFPRERERILSQLTQLQARDAVSRERLLAPFRTFELPASLEAMDWVSEPGHYLDVLTATLWSSGQMPRFRQAAKDFVEAFPDPTQAGAAVPRHVLILLDGTLEGLPAFRKLRSHGLALRIADRDGWQGMLRHTAERASAHPSEYGHWYIDGGSRRDAEAMPRTSQSLTVVSYDALAPVRASLLARARNAMSAESSGPEQLRTLLMQTTPEQMGMDRADSALTHFQLSLLTEGSGTQIFATTFVQWAARECLRRAEPNTLLLRFTPRQAEQGMNEMLSGAPPAGLDTRGSLVDAEQGAWYTWINLQRLPGAETASCLVWHERTGEAAVLGPGLTAGKALSAPQTMSQALRLLS